MGVLHYQDTIVSGGLLRTYHHVCPHGDSAGLDVRLIDPIDRYPTDWERVATLAAVAKFRAYYRLRGCGCEVQEEA